MIGKIGICSRGRPALITGRKTLPWGESWVGVGLDNGTQWASREPRILTDAEIRELGDKAPPVTPPDSGRREAFQEVLDRLCSLCREGHAPDDHPRGGAGHLVDGYWRRCGRDGVNYFLARWLKAKIAALAASTPVAPPEPGTLLDRLPPSGTIGGGDEWGENGRDCPKCGNPDHCTCPIPPAGGTREVVDALERIAWHELTWKEARDLARSVLARREA